MMTQLHVLLLELTFNLANADCRSGIYATPLAAQPQTMPAAAPQAVVASAYPPPVASPDPFGKPPMGRAAPVGLSQALAAQNLAHFEAGLRGLGVADSADVVDLKEAACVAIGMKKLEFKRLQRVAA